MALERAVLFIDGSNFYHAAKNIGIATGELDYQKLADKLILNRRQPVSDTMSGRFPAISPGAHLNKSF